MAWRDLGKKRAYEAAYHAAYRLANHELLKKKREARCDLMNTYLGGECSECLSVYNLEIHHINRATKQFNPRAKALKRWDFLVPELDKCVLLCSACHKAEHATKHGGWRMFNRGCRCGECVSACSEKKRINDRLRRERQRQEIHASTP